LAQPTNPLIVWASDDVILPNAQRPNKTLPSESLIQTGWDLSQKPAADEWNYLLNNNGQYIKWLIEEKINEFLKKSENLSDLNNTTTSRANLDVFSKSEVNSKTVSAGNGLTGGGDLSTNRTISMGNPSTVGPATSNTASGTTHTHALDATGNVVVLTGTIAHGGTIPLPSGYTEAQCKWSVSINSQVTALSTDGSDDRTYLRCFTTGRVVSCYMSTKNTPEEVKESGVANYIIIGVK
jgi:hypothetical protein